MVGSCAVQERRFGIGRGERRPTKARAQGTHHAKPLLALRSLRRAPPHLLPGRDRAPQHDAVSVVELQHPAADVEGTREQALGARGGGRGQAPHGRHLHGQHRRGRVVLLALSLGQRKRGGRATRAVPVRKRHFQTAIRPVGRGAAAPAHDRQPLLVFLCHVHHLLHLDQHPESVGEGGLAVGRVAVGIGVAAGPRLAHGLAQRRGAVAVAVARFPSTHDVAQVRVQDLLPRRVRQPVAAVVVAVVVAVRRARRQPAPARADARGGRQPFLQHAQRRGGGGGGGIDHFHGVVVVVRIVEDAPPSRHSSKSKVHALTFLFCFRAMPAMIGGAKCFSGVFRLFNQRSNKQYS